MKKVLYIFLIVLVIVSCKKTKFSPEGPTDIRVRNLSSYTFTNVIVKTAGGKDTTGNIKNLGTILPGQVSPYKRFAIAYYRAEISATINGEIYSTGTINSTYWNYIGQDKITYEVYVKQDASKLLDISDYIDEAPIDSL
ncbi:MAG: hypothetical protein ABSA76_04775 [Bacteroidales bacterium]